MWYLNLLFSIFAPQGAIYRSWDWLTESLVISTNFTEITLVREGLQDQMFPKYLHFCKFSENDYLTQWQNWQEVSAMEGRKEGLGGGGQAYHDNGRILRVLGCRTRCDAITLWWEAASIAWNTLPNSQQQKVLARGRPPLPLPMP